MALFIFQNSYITSISDIIIIIKEQLHKQIESFPDKLNIEELIDKLLLIDKIDSHIKESDENITITNKQLDNEITSRNCRQV